MFVCERSCQPSRLSQLVLLCSSDLADSRLVRTQTTFILMNANRRHKTIVTTNPNEKKTFFHILLKYGSESIFKRLEASAAADVQEMCKGVAATSYFYNDLPTECLHPRGRKHGNALRSQGESRKQGLLFQHGVSLKRCWCWMLQTPKDTQACNLHCTQT